MKHVHPKHLPKAPVAKRKKKAKEHVKEFVFKQEEFDKFRERRKDEEQNDTPRIIEKSKPTSKEEPQKEETPKPHFFARFSLKKHSKSKDVQQKAVKQKEQEETSHKPHFFERFSFKKHSTPKDVQGKKAPEKPEATPAEKTAERKDEKPAAHFFDRFFHKKETTPKTKEDRAAQIVKGMRHQKKKKRKKLQRKSLQEYLFKAGYDIQAEQVRKGAFYAVLVIFSLATLYVLLKASAWGAGALDTLVFILGLWTVVFLGVLLVVWGSVFFFLDYRIHNRTKQLEDVLPDFLQLASANIAAGMPVDRALWYSIRPNFGVLAKEMEEVAKATMAGEDLEQSLIAFTDKYESNTLKRSVSILIEGMHSGGQMADLLNKIALNIDELKIMKKEMAANVTTYAIFIMFAAVAVSPFLFALATQLLVIISDITSTLDLSATGSLFSFSSPDPALIGNFRTFSILSLLFSTSFAGAIVSVIRKGTVLESVKAMPVYAIIAITIYFFSSSMLSGVFSGIV
ncbi:MAG: type II secretion system F family protein [Candidatus Woesearchaeota archaeon]|nr:type II secretion system F family protein [Candidatus Woesearchaeota archaeon]